MNAIFSKSEWKVWAKNFPLFAAQDAPPVKSPFRVIKAKSKTETHEILIYGAIGRDYFSNDGVVASEYAQILSEIPRDEKVKLRIQSPGGNFYEGLAIYNLSVARGVDTIVDGQAASVAADIFCAGQNREIPDESNIMIHKSWGCCVGNTDDMTEMKKRLDNVDALQVSILTKATGKSADEILAKMSEETEFNGVHARDYGFGIAPVKPKEPAAKISQAIQASAPLSAAPANGGQQTNPQPQEPTMNKKTIVALLLAHGIKDSNNKDLTEQSPDADFEAALNALATKKLQKDFSAENLADIKALREDMKAFKKARIEDKVNAAVDSQKITKAEAKLYIATAMTSAEAETEVFAIIAEREAATAAPSAGLDIQITDHSPTISASGVQGSKIVPELENIFAAHKEPAGATSAQRVATANARYEALKAEFPRILQAAFRKDNGVQAGNTFSATVTTNFLIQGVIVKLYNRFAAAKLFTRDAEQDPYKPLAAGIRKFNTTTTDGSKVGVNVTNFETLAGGTNGNPDSVVDAITITPAQYTSGGYITNAQLNSGFRVADITEAKLVDLGAKSTQIITAPITVANFTTNAALVSAPAAFGFSDLATLQGQLKKSMVKNLLLDGEYQARIANTPGFFQQAGLVGGNPGAWSAFGWDNVALNTDWSGAGANVRGFACNPQAIGIISGLPLNPPEGIPGNIVQMGVAQLPDVGIAIAVYVWFSPQSRTLYFTYDIMLGATLIDETAGVLIKSA